LHIYVFNNDQYQFFALVFLFFELFFFGTFFDVVALPAGSSVLQVSISELLKQVPNTMLNYQRNHFLLQ